MKTHLDLFSGIGGFAIAAQNCGYTTIGFCEKEPYAQQILKERFGAVLADASCSTITTRNDRRKEHQPCEVNEIRNKHRTSSPRPKLHDDIFTLNGADYAGVDLLTGGFPCQPFSVAGKRRGAADDRALWPEMLRVIGGAKPAWLIGENVAGIVTMELDNILSDLEGIGYSAWPLVIPACAVDARHRRDRVWIVAHAARELRDGGGNAGKGRRIEHSDGGEDVADTMRVGRPGQGKSINAEHPAPAGDGQATQPWDGCRPARWLPEPELGRVAHGIPHRAHRLRGLGNAIVPQVAEEIIRAINKT
jgi:DNA (cytosine-5)-methyltransferase 1